MNENLKVTAKSDILEFKRKHNLLVEKVNGGEFDFANLVDSQGHKRFIEGDITIETISGIEQKYGKWSLSGTHLQIVLAVDIANGTTLGVKLADVNLPAWIREKIIPLYSTRVAYKNELALGNDSTSQQITFLVDKTDNGISIYSYASITANRHVRFELDLLIDNAEPETQEQGE